MELSDLCLRSHLCNPSRPPPRIRALAAELSGRRECEQLLSDKTELARQLERRAAEVARLTHDLADRAAELDAANAAKCRALVQVEETAAKEISLQYR